MIRLPDTIVGRAVLILVGALLAFHLMGYWAYRVGVEDLATTARDQGLAERIVSIKRAIASIPDEIERDRAAHALASTSLEVHWSKASLILGNVPGTLRAQAMNARLRELAPEFASEAFRVGFADDGALEAGDSDAYRHTMLVSLRLDDGSWINFASPTFGTAHVQNGKIPLVAACIGIGIALISILLLSWVTRPLQELAIAAERFSLDEAHESVSEAGPAEVRRAAKAFNTMGNRVRRLVFERTQALAAVSHDLRTPITRLRLRSELMDDEAARALIDEDLGEMESMINSTLEFLKMGVSSEPVRNIDIVSVLKTIVDQEADRGQTITLDGISHAFIDGQLVALKRAFWNLIGNALKYASDVQISVMNGPSGVLIAIRDDGPGIPDKDMSRVFEPFFRVEMSRSRETGGAGLGLTIARAIIRSHGGDIVLGSLRSGGLEAVVQLPQKASSESARQNASN